MFVVRTCESKKQFTDHERDGILTASYEYIARYFRELPPRIGRRNTQIQGRLKELDRIRFARPSTPWQTAFRLPRPGQRWRDQVQRERGVCLRKL